MHTNILHNKFNKPAKTKWQVPGCTEYPGSVTILPAFHPPVTRFLTPWDQLSRLILKIMHFWNKGELTGLIEGKGEDTQHASETNVYLSPTWKQSEGDAASKVPEKVRISAFSFSILESQPQYLRTSFLFRTINSKGDSSLAFTQVTLGFSFLSVNYDWAASVWNGIARVCDLIKWVMEVTSPQCSLFFIDLFCWKTPNSQCCATLATLPSLEVEVMT